VKWSNITALPKSMGRRMLAREIIMSIDADKLISTNCYSDFNATTGKCESCAIGAAYVVKSNFDGDILALDLGHQEKAQDAMQDMGWTRMEIDIIDYVFEGVTFGGVTTSPESREEYKGLRKALHGDHANRSDRMRAIWDYIYHNDAGKLMPDAYLPKGESV
jgi:hypothetical protein